MLIGKRVVLEEIALENIEQLRKWRNDPELRQYFREYKDITTDKQLAWYQERGNNSNNNNVYFQIMMKDQLLYSEQAAIDNRKLIGCCGVLNVDWRIRSGELSIFLSKNFHGLGLGEESLLLLMHYVFEELNLHKFWGECYDSNAAIDLYTRVGFGVDGFIRDSWYHNGKYGGSYVFSMLDTEWRQRG